MEKKNDIEVGSVFGRLTVLDIFTKNNGRKPERWARCSCAGHLEQAPKCKRTKDVRLNELRADRVKSCGCLRRQVANHARDGRTTHPYYRVWEGMIDRYNRKYAYKGIEIAPEFDDFWTFIAYIEEELGPRPKGFSLNRIDNTAGYIPGNLEWADNTTQMRNRDVNTMLTVNGKTQCIADWADETGLSQATICVRLKRGWSPEKAVLTLARNYQKKHK